MKHCLTAFFLLVIQSPAAIVYTPTEVLVEFSGAVWRAEDTVHPIGTAASGQFRFNLDVADGNPDPTIGDYSNIDLSGNLLIGGEALSFTSMTAEATIRDSIIGEGQDLISIRTQITPTSFAGINITSVGFGVQDEFSTQSGSTINSDALDLSSFIDVAFSSTQFDFRRTESGFEQLKTSISIETITISQVPEPSSISLFAIFCCFLFLGRCRAINQ